VRFTVIPGLSVLNVDLASCHVSSAKNLDVVPTFLEVCGPLP